MALEELMAMLLTSHLRVGVASLAGSLADLHSTRNGEIVVSLLVGQRTRSKRTKARF